MVTHGYLWYTAPMSTVTLSKKQIQKNGGVVVLPIEEYRRLSLRALPEYYLTGKKARNLDKLVENGLREYHAGKTMKASSVREALQGYELGKCRKIKSLADLD